MNECIEENKKNNASYSISLLPPRYYYQSILCVCKVVYPFFTVDRRRKKNNCVQYHLPLNNFTASVFTESRNI